MTKGPFSSDPWRTRWHRNKSRWPGAMLELRKWGLAGLSLAKDFESKAEQSRELFGRVVNIALNNFFTGQVAPGRLISAEKAPPQSSPQGGVIIESKFGRI